MKHLIIAILTMTLLSCSDTCLNPDCEFPKMEAPIILIEKSFDHVTCVDNTGARWASSTGWYVAQGIVEKGYNIGDTIVYKYHNTLRE